MSKPIGPGVTRANMVLVWHKGQSGRSMVMMLSPLVQAGALPNSQSPIDTEGGGDAPACDLPLKFHPVAVRVSADVTPFGAV
jgi:hypothetical protein